MPMIPKMTFEAFSRRLDSVAGQDSAYPPEADDLYFLYSFARDKSLVSVLEFGSGWSTYAFALAIKENEVSFGDKHRKNVRHPNAFKILSIDASPSWSILAKERQERNAPASVDYLVSSPSAYELGGPGGPICSLFEKLPYFVADLVYLDGPDSDQITNVVRSHGSIQPHSLPMAADLLSVEPHFWPGAYIITDGRFANANFLRSHFRRNWEFLADPFADRCIFRLVEEELGQVNREHNSLRLRESADLLSKEGPL